MQVDSVIAAVKDYIPEDYDSLKLLEERVGNLSEEERNNFVSKILPQLGLVTSRQVLTTHFFFGLFGYGRALAGDWIGAIMSLLLLILASCKIFIFGIDVVIKAKSFFGLPFFLLMLFLIWLTEFYSLGKQVRTKNLEKILVWLETPTLRTQRENFLGQ